MGFALQPISPLTLKQAFGLYFQRTGDTQPQNTEAGHAGDGHEERGPGMGEDKHGGHFFGGQAEEAGEDEETGKFVATNLSRRRG